MNLYEISKKYLDLFQKAEEISLAEEVTEDDIQNLEQELQINEQELIEKSTAYSKYIKNLEGDIDSIEKEIKRLEKIKKSKESLVKNLKSRLQTALELFGKDKLDLGLFKISFRKSESVQTQIDKIYTDLVNIKIDITEKDLKDNEQMVLEDIKDYIKIDYSLSVDKTKLKKALKEGKLIPSAELIQNKNIQIN